MVNDNSGKIETVWINVDNASYICADGDGSMFVFVCDKYISSIEPLTEVLAKITSASSVRR
jgi:hypothetical protein